MNENQMIKGIQRDDRYSLEILINQYGPLLNGVISKTLWKYPHLIDDALNESFLAIWKNINAYDRNRSSFKNWCATIARYQAIDILRRETRQHQSRVEQTDAIETLSQDMKHDWQFMLEDLLADFTELDRQIFMALFVEGKSYEEVAKKHNIRISNLYNRVSRCRKSLKLKK